LTTANLLEFREQTKSRLKRSAYFKIKEAFISQVSLQPVADLHAAHAWRGTGKNKIPDIDREITCNMSYECIKREKHIPGIPLLYLLAVLLEGKGQV
jgi:hypothetical protein